MTSPSKQTIASLSRLLDQAVREARFDIQSLAQNSRAEMLCDAEQLRTLMGDDQWRWSHFSLISTSLRTELLDALVECIRRTLRNHIIDDRVGMGLLMFLKGVSRWHPPVTELALDCVRASVFLGSKKVVDLLSSWERGIPIPYRCILLLSGVTVDEPVQLNFGEEGGVVLFEKLPLSTDEIRRILPPHSEFSNPLMNLPGAVMMTSTHGAKSSVFQDSKGQVERPSIDEWDEVSSPYRAISHLMDALSIACNTHVSWTMSWAESEDWRAFGDQEKRLQIYSSARATQKTKVITAAQLNDVRALLSKWQRIAENQKLMLAISRWYRSKRPTGLPDQLIELRIALEALYLDNDVQGELSFRLATHVAWHLGENLQDRLDYQRTIRDVYALASRVLHGQVVQLGDDDRQLLTQAQDLCRLGILKILDDGGRIPVWREIMLGSRLD